MKKFLSMTLTLIMLMAFAVPAFAVDKESDLSSAAEVQEEILERASEFAYLDADKATPELKEKILEARKEIIYNTDWVADGYVGCIRNIKTGKLIKELPEFSEVFPEWDVPVEENNAKIEISEPVLPAAPADNAMEIKPLSIGVGLDDWIVLLSERVYLKSASSTTDATPFAAFTLDPYKMGTHKALQPKIKIEYWKDGKHVRSAGSESVLVRTEYYEFIDGEYRLVET